MSITPEALLEFFKSSLGVDTSEIDGSTALYSSGLLDSFSIVSLIQFIEDESGARLEPADVSVDNFDTIHQIVEFLSQVQARG